MPIEAVKKLRTWARVVCSLMIIGPLVTWIISMIPRGSLYEQTREAVRGVKPDEPWSAPGWLAFMWIACIVVLIGVDMVTTQWIKSKANNVRKVH